MTDHPLIPQVVRSYMEKHQIEPGLNKALNTVLKSMPQDPFSTMAVELLDINPSAPSFKCLKAKPTYLSELSIETLQIDVYLQYQGIERCFFSYVYTYNESEIDALTWDDEEEKTGMTNACAIINKLSDQLAEKDIYQYKKIDTFLQGYAQRKAESGQKVGPNVTAAISQALFSATAAAEQGQFPFLSMYK